jgi:hypothetical protein
MCFRVLLSLPYHASGPDKVCNDCTLYSWPHMEEKRIQKVFLKGLKIYPVKGVDMIRKYGIVEV